MCLGQLQQLRGTYRHRQHCTRARFWPSQQASGGSCRCAFKTLTLLAYTQPGVYATTLTKVLLFVCAGTASYLSEQGSQQSSLSPTRRHRSGFSDWQDGSLGAVELGLTNPAVVVAVHQGTQEVFAGTRNGFITLLGRQQSAF